MSQPDNGDITVFDRLNLRRHRERAVAEFADHAFLVDEVAERIAERLDDINRPFPNALDLGSHHGPLGRALQARPGHQSLLSTDLALGFAKQSAGHHLQADEEFLPFAPQSFDLVTSAMSLHWVNDLPGALVQIRQTLRPDGLFIGTLFGSETLKELRQAFLEAETAIEGGVSPRVSPFTDVRLAGALLQRAGFALPVADADLVTVTYSDVFALMRDLKGMGESNVHVDRRRGFTNRRTIVAAAEAYHATHALPDGRIPATFQIIYLTGWAPHESQQKPLRPGSAKTRLADVLGVKEGKL
ncbi:methyltransferase domain-containing protein [Govanella unica]|uniref:Methyltransferase domain-containing protein n=1 Tax=Govanella unica TaxID=2975056 RepID=A0A9X3TV95_9PROT|nr:methyltransferase domain-containing protein [Govania unica]MDA5192357.1 methyltransferase domain-containing protein [Govania unica]